jgi:hypothetical protein
MSFEALLARGQSIGDKAQNKVRDQILARADLPDGVAARAVPGGIAITGKRLRHRMMTDTNLRNFAR